MDTVALNLMNVFILNYLESTEKAGEAAQNTR
jgi:hypothetical protein